MSIRETFEETGLLLATQSDLAIDKAQSLNFYYRENYERVNECK